MTTTTLPACGPAAAPATGCAEAARAPGSAPPCPHPTNDNAKNAATATVFERFTCTLRFVGEVISPREARSLPRSAHRYVRNFVISSNPRCEVRVFMKRWPAFFVAAALAGCNGLLSPAPGSAPLVSRAAGVSGGKIQHVVFIIQENRSFDNLFQGYPGADTVSSGKNSKGETIALQPVSLATQYEIDHSLAAFVAACDG